MDSTKLLTEKLALARELSSLKPEIDHLRSQAASHQSLLTEKLSLQRQLSTLQAELEMEKRSTQRAMAKEEKAQAQDSKLATQLDELRAEVAKERKERQRMESEAQKASTELLEKKANFESRLDVFKCKLKSTNNQLKETQTELQKAEANAAKDAGKGARKRAASRMDDDTMIGTPGDLRAGKKTKRTSTLPGDKSTFSITPFLNRTASVAPESPAQESDDAQPGQDAEREETSGPEMNKANGRASSKATESPTGNRKATSSQKPSAKPATLGRAKPSKSNAKNAPVRKPKPASTLEQVTEEIDDENAAPAGNQPKPSATESIVGDTTEVEIKKKKRKLLGGGLGRTLFDDDDDAVAEKPSRFGNKGAFSFQRVNLGGPKAGSRPGLGGVMSGFGDFSPLKKDRKASVF